MHVDSVSGAVSLEGDEVGCDVENNKLEVAVVSLITVSGRSSEEVHQSIVGVERQDGAVVVGHLVVRSLCFAGSELACHGCFRFGELQTVYESAVSFVAVGVIVHDPAVFRAAEGFLAFLQALFETDRWFVTEEIFLIFEARSHCHG